MEAEKCTFFPQEKIFAPHAHICGKATALIIAPVEPLTKDPNKGTTSLQRTLLDLFPIAVVHF